MDRLLNWVTNTLDEFGGILVVDRAGTIVHVSPRFAEYLLGVSAEEAVGQPLEQMVPESGLSEVMSSGIPQIGRFWNIRGQSLVVSRLPVRENGEVAGAIGITIFRGFESGFSFVGETSPEDSQLAYYKEEVQRLWGAKYDFDSIIGSSLAIVEAKRRAWDVAAAGSPVLILGETGTGKELFAHAIHQDSQVKNGPFVAINCASIPDHLVESELFGYEEGAFSGARKGGKPGKFELAHQGTIFLDEVGELPLGMQAKLLRVLEQKEVERVGGTRPVPVKVRVISASNVDMEKRIKEGSFREDLYYRLNVLSINIPPLRQRVEDIPSLAYHFVTMFNGEMGIRISGISDDALQILMRYAWPGNIRELRNTIERACLNARMGLIKPDDLYYLRDKAVSGGGRSADNAGLTLKEAANQAEKAAILEALRKAGGNKKLACDILKINRTSFYKKLKEHDIPLS